MNFLLLEALYTCQAGMGDALIPLVAFSLSVIDIDLLAVIDWRASLNHTHTNINSSNYGQ